MPAISHYRERLADTDDLVGFLLAESGLPGPRGNIELGRAFAEMADRATILSLLEWTPGRAPANTPEEFLAFCGALGLGRLAAEGDDDALARLRELASDPRWRTREAVAMALQQVGERDWAKLVQTARSLAAGGPLEQRAAAAALCEPRLLDRPERVADTLSVLDTITASLEADEADEEGRRTLVKGLGYCWSVAVAADPELGRPAFERWLESDHPDVRRVVRENLKKARLSRMDASWVADCQGRL